MPASVTSNFRIANAKAFVDSFEEPENGGRNTVVGQSYVYLFIGNDFSWDKTHAGFSDAVIPAPDGDVQGNEFEPWRDMIALDRVIANTDISFAAKRYDWALDRVYSQYDDQDPTITKASSNYYVFDTSTNQVFKCLDNNNAAVSTVRPSTSWISGSPELPFVTSDGYRWKYICTVTTNQFAKWLTKNYIPIRTLNAIPGSSGGADTELTIPPAGFADQAAVQLNANNGAIETYVVNHGGAGFIKHSGAIADVDRTIVTDIGITGSTTTKFKLKATGSLSIDADAYNGAAIFVSNNTHEKGVSLIKDYGVDVAIAGAGSVYGVEIDPALDAEFAIKQDEVGVKYHIGPAIEVIGDGPRNADGTGGANAYAICTSSGAISKINAWTSGNNYTTATVSVVGTPTPSGSGLIARAVIPPPGGHGSDPVAELGAFNVVVSKTFSGSGINNPVARGSVLPTNSPVATHITGNNFPISNEFRTVGLLRNPYITEDYDASVLAPATSSKNWYANSSPLHQSTWIVANTELDGRSGGWTPQPDDEIQGSYSKATGRVIEYNTDGRGIINITNVTANSTGGGFTIDERINRLRDKAGTSYSGVFVTANGWATAVDTYDDRPSPTGSLSFDNLSTVIYQPDLAPYTGDILYIENRSPITRSPDQSEEIKIVIEF